MKDVNYKNFKSLAAIQRLDEVLKILSTSNVPFTISVLQTELLRNEISCPEREILEKVLTKLVIDRYVDKVSPIDQPDGKYLINFDGEVFFETGGYQALKIVFENQKRQENRVFLLTSLVAVGTGIAAIYYIIEISKFLNKNWNSIADFFSCS